MIILDAKQTYMMVINMKGYNPTKFSNKVTIAFLKGINYRKDLLLYDISKHEAINRLKNVNFNKAFIIESKLRKKDMAQKCMESH